MLEAKEVNFAYRRGLPVLNDIACTIGDGEFVALLGHNGSGKTTLSRLFMALLHPRSGQVLVDGEDIVNYEPGFYCYPAASGVRAGWCWGNLNNGGNAGLACRNSNNSVGDANWNGSVGSTG